MRLLLDDEPSPFDYERRNVKKICWIFLNQSKTNW